MLKGKVRYALCALCASVMMACHDSFDEVVSLPYDPNEDFSTDEVKKDMVPINVSLLDPELTIFATRGAGAMDLDREDCWSVWGSSDRNFRVLALRVPNKLSTVTNDQPANFADWKDLDEGGEPTTNCLLPNVPVQFTTHQSPYGLTLLDKNRNSHVYYYDQEHQDYRYKFFINHLDDAKVTKTEKTADRVVKHVEIDGSQDLMVGFAMHSGQDFTDFLTRNSSNGNSEMRLLTQNKEQLAYSTIAAHRGLNPQFWLKHVLTGFYIKVKGCPIMTTVEQPDGSSINQLVERYKNIIITGMTFESPYQGDIVLADNRWDFSFSQNEMQSDFLEDCKEGKLFVPDSTKTRVLDVSLLNTENAEEDGEGNVKVNGDVIPASEYIPREAVESKLSGYKWDSFYQVYHNVGRQLGRNMFMVPVHSRYTITLNYLYVQTSVVDGKVVIDDIVPYMSTYTVEKPEDDAGFKPSYKYYVELSVYGPQDIRMNVRIEPNWIDGGDIILDPDDK